MAHHGSEHILAMFICAREVEVHVTMQLTVILLCLYSVDLF